MFVNVCASAAAATASQRALIGIDWYIFFTFKCVFGTPPLAFTLQPGFFNVHC